MTGGNTGLSSQMDTNGKPSLSGRLTLRLPAETLDWIRQRGGSSYVRELLAKQQNGTIDGDDHQPSLRSINTIQDQREDLILERDLLAVDREILEDEERILERRQSQLDEERLLLDERREQLEDEWYELEQIRLDLDARLEVLATAHCLLLYHPKNLLGPDWGLDV